MACVDEITISDFKSQFRRDFPYAPTAVIGTDEELEYILDEDITNAFTQAKCNFNENIFSDDGCCKLAYLYLSAHYLSHDMKTAQNGINSTGAQNVASRSVGSVSESYSIPEEYQKDPYLNFFTTTGYGIKYLSLVMPLIRGNVYAVQGATLP